ncbi:hypothetical protein LPJ64_005809, partial [Coemansia asiatica]
FRKKRFKAGLAQAVERETLNLKVADDFEQIESSSELLQFLTASEVQLVSSLTQTQPSIRTGWELSCETRGTRTFSTSIKELDKLLGGQGFAVRKASVCEIVGQPGEGQTELCLRLAIAAQTAGLRAVYVDSTGSFSYGGASRAAQRLREQIQNECENENGSGDMPGTNELLEGIKA